MDEQAQGPPERDAGQTPAELRRPAPAAPHGVEGNDAVCFTAGLAGAAFGAGTIHAFLAADRRAPAVAAGISLGALNAAAMQQVYQELEKVQPQQKPPSVQDEIQREAGRWRWYREYVEALSDRPLSPFWESIPDQSDFFADMVPIQDASAPASLEDEEREARRRRYLLVRLGQWLARLPVSVGLVATLVVSWVRLREKFPVKQKVAGAWNLLRAGVALITQVILHAGVAPQLFPEHRFVSKADPGKAPGFARWLPHKGLGFLAWLNLFNFTVAILFGLVVLIVVFGLTLAEEQEERLLRSLQLVAGVLLVTTLIVLTQKARRWLMERRLVQALLLVFGWLVYAISWINLLSLTFVGTFGYSLVLDYLNRRDYKLDQELAFGFFALLMLPCLLLAPFVVIPETRKWMIEHGFLQQWKRPLFGWPIYLFLGLHLLGLAGYLAVGEAFIYEAAWRSAHPFDWRLTALANTRLTLIPLAAIAVMFLLGQCRKWLGRRGLLRNWHAPLPGPGWVLYIAGSLAVLGATGVWFHLRLMKFTRYVDVGNLPAHFHLWEVFYASAWVLFATWLVIFGVLFIPELGYLVFSHVLDKLGLRRGLIHDYQLKRKLLQLFDPEWKANARNPQPEEVLLKEAKDTPVRVLLVAAPLPTLFENSQPLSAFQLWARPGTPLLHALRAALAAPPLLEPVRLETPKELGWWLKGTVQAEWENTKKSRKGAGLDLVDGGVIRQNPLPALFSYLRGDQELAQRLEENNDKDHPAIHVVYRVPLEGRPAPEAAAAEAPAKEKVSKYNIVDVLRLSLRLSARRDTQLEVAQTNTISRMEVRLREAGGAPGVGKNRSTAIFADEIAPQEELLFENELNPSRDEMLRSVAAGCRRTLETLYRDTLDASHWPWREVECRALLETIAPRRVRLDLPAPGLPEVCQKCTRMLQRPPEKEEEEARRSTVLVADSLEGPRKLVSALPWLSGEKPRIVFVASGGVFRGAFHIGMLAALKVCAIKPDLIVGASVGTLMGGALGAMFSTQQDILSHLVQTFLRVDEKVALTKTLKGAARELGLRGRLIHLSPRRVRQLVLRGSRSDPGFAAAGAPAALIDALSDLFMIPHRKTSEIAAEFVAGHVTHATNLFLQQLKEETLERMDIESAVIGTSLLEPVARELLGAAGTALTLRQPFTAAKIAFYGTTTNLVTQSPTLLGGNRQWALAPYDYVEAALASSAFPAVFAPRPESSIFPGLGRADILYSDGGMFDNLPFMPAIEILSRGQEGYRRAWGRGRSALDFLKARHQSPDLMIAGALNALPEQERDATGPFDSLAKIHKRAAALQNNVKIRSFEYASARIHDQAARYINAQPNASWTRGRHPADTSDFHAADRIVTAAVLPVFPASRQHLNGTFAFSASTGLEPGRVRKSIADGCYQTLRVLAEPQNASEPAAKSVLGLMAAQKIPEIAPLAKDDRPGKRACRFFKWNDAQRGGPPVPQECPFAAGGKDSPGWGVYVACRKDSAHPRA